MSDLKVILVEMPSAFLLHDYARMGNNNPSGFTYVYGDPDVHTFSWKEFRPLRLKSHPEAFLLYVEYSETELAELYQKVNMNPRVEPVDQLEYCIRMNNLVSRSFDKDNPELAKLGEFEFYKFKKLSNESGEVAEDQSYRVLETLFGKKAEEEELSNYLLLFHNQNSMLHALSLLIIGHKVPAENIRWGMTTTMPWVLALKDVSLDVEQVSRLTALTHEDDFDIVQHSKQVMAETYGFTWVPNVHATAIVEHRKRTQALGLA